MINKPTDRAVIEWELRRREALLAGDTTALEGLLSDALVYVHSTAAGDTKDSYLRKIRDGVLRYLSLEFSDLQAQVLPGAALVTGRMRATVLKEGQEKQVSSVFLTVWVPEPSDAGSAWRLRAHQGTPLS
ncbi:MAG: nuclear transport factor 2 family protein [Burkholderiaceae bacterium]|nr:nuclear transport factor 2 family protein [Polaromonas sp.]MDO8776063.1 nuclear transport factor 2 family protein [Burkholderiaceae bacterium]